MYFNQKHIFHKSLISPWPFSPSHIPPPLLYRENAAVFIPHSQFSVKPEGCTVATQRNGGKHVAFNLSVRVTARPSET